MPRPRAVDKRAALEDLCARSGAEVVSVSPMPAIQDWTLRCDPVGKTERTRYVAVTARFDALELVFHAPERIGLHLLPAVGEILRTDQPI